MKDPLVNWLRLYPHAPDSSENLDAAKNLKTDLKDSFLWPTIALPSIVLSVVLVCIDILFSFDPGSFTILSMLAATFWPVPVTLILVWLCIVLGNMFSALLHGLQKKALSSALSVLCLWPTFFFIERFPVFHIGDSVHLAVAYPEYQKQIDLAPTTRLEFDWGTFGLLSGGSRTLVYDPADTLPQENKALNNKINGGYGDGGLRYVRTQHLLGHFYVVDHLY